MSSVIIASIPVKPWLKKFVLNIERKKEDDFIDLNDNTLVAKMIKVFLTGKAKLSKRKDKNKIGIQYTEILKFKIPYKDIHEGRICIEPQSISFLNNLLHNFFHEMLLERILLGQKYGVCEKKIISDFMKQYGLIPEVDLQIDSAKKANYRLRETKKIENFYTPNGRARKRGAKELDYQYVIN